MIFYSTFSCSDALLWRWPWPRRLKPNTHRRRDSTVAWRCVRNSQLVGDSLDESEQICQQRSRVASCRLSERTRRKSWPSLQFPVPLSYWGWNKWRHSDVIVENSVSIKIHASNRYGVSTVSLFRQSSWASCEFMYTPPTPTRRNSTVELRLRRRCVLGINGFAVWQLHPWPWHVTCSTAVCNYFAED